MCVFTDKNYKYRFSNNLKKCPNSDFMHFNL